MKTNIYQAFLLLVLFISMGGCKMSDCECSEAISFSAKHCGMASHPRYTSKEIGQCTNRYLGEPTTSVVVGCERLERAAQIAAQKCN